MYSKFIKSGYLSFKKRPYLPVLLSILQGVIAIILFNLNIPNRNTLTKSFISDLTGIFIYFSIHFYVSEIFLFHLRDKLGITMGFFPSTLRGVNEKMLNILGLIPVFGTIFVLINSIRFFGLFKNQDDELF